MIKLFHHTAIGSALLVLLFSCKDDDKAATDGCNIIDQDCETDLVCEQVNNGETICAMPLYIRGTTLDFSNETPVPDAVIQALDPNLSPIGRSDVSASDGVFLLQVPAVRDENGVPLDDNYTLRAQAAGYQLFPSSFRPSLPLNASSAVEEADGWVIESALSTISLLPLPDAGTAMGTISGAIRSESCAGILVVAESDNTGLPGYSDDACNFVIFNVPAGSYTVSGYAANIQLTSVSVDVVSGETTTGVVLDSRDSRMTTVKGNVQIVNAPGDSVTSVVLAVESTFVESVQRGQVPPGLRAGEVTGAFEFSNVPDGRYVVLAAFENDALVRDPDESIGGTQIVHIEVPPTDGGELLQISDGFKVTEALEVVAPGAVEPEGVTTPTPTFEWTDDSSEDTYIIIVYDAFGDEIWKESIDGVSGQKTVSLTYAGPELETGMYYQFRVTSQKDGTSISATEDLRGVFFLAL